MASLRTVGLVVAAIFFPWGNAMAAVAPIILGQPASHTVTVGQTATLSVMAVGTQPLKYQWKRGGVPIARATSWSYTTPPATLVNKGVFTVEISNLAGKVTSKNAILIVNEKVDPSLIGYWKLDDGKGAVATDSSGNGRDGTLANGPAWTTGVRGGALDFDGTRASVTIPNGPALNPARLTLSAWVRGGRDAARKQCILAKDDGTNCQFSLSVAKGVVAFTVANSEVTGPMPGGLFPAEWYHVTGTYDGAALRLYFNGSLGNSVKAAPKLADNGAPLVMGGRSSTTAPEFLKGGLADVRVYNRALTEPEIRNISGMNPDFADVSYGTDDDPQTTLDFWKAPSAEPSPILLYIHGGAFSGGDKGYLGGGNGADLQMVMDEIIGCLSHGVSFASVNYRTLCDSQVVYPTPFRDCARAVQFLRSKAADWNLDPTRVASMGGSAGAGISLWLNFHDDLADPRSNDPVARQSTRLTCSVGFMAQASYDPRWIMANIPHFEPWRFWIVANLFGIQKWDKDSILEPPPDKAALFRDASMIEHLDSKDGPTWLWSGFSPKADRVEWHAAMFGQRLKEKYDELRAASESPNMECVFYHKDTPAEEMTESDVHFVLRHFGVKP